MVSLQTRMTLLIVAFFAIIYATIVLIGTAMGINDFYFYLIISVGIMWIQYMIGPNMVEWTMQVRYIQREDNPVVFDMVGDLARRANIPMPRICIAPTDVPNAFAFGRGVNDGRVCICQGIFDLLSEEELKAVLGHELTHLKSNDVITITLLSVVPMILYRLAWQLMWFGGDRRENRNAPSGAVLALIAFVFYFITNLLVLYGSRIREYYADKGSVELGNKPSALASALYKLVYGCAKKSGDEDMKAVEGMKAFFLNDPSQAINEIHELSELDLNKDGKVDQEELFRLKGKEIRLGFQEKMMELFSTHPNMLKRIKQLSQYA